ncbi:PadR family transcriptional regulator [Arthrobacter sp. HY1533]|uniref:PadR family transcriptional regulator n=1 Tax=Arthrobacter sp. HY1533 TaxID=2970919 RepID=UPI0022B9FBA2|nr:PadR family transcriptional regulator [Arthrobacter sp. HY1533]
MNNFTFPQEPRKSGRRPHGLRRHHEGHSPTGNGDFEGPSKDWTPDEGRGRRGFGPGGPGFGRGGFGPGFGGPGGPGFGGPGGFGPGPGGPRGPGFRAGFGRGGRVRKGNVRSAILSLLSQHSYNGYGMIGAIAAHTDGAWRPSPGSIYPALAALQSEGLIEASGDGKRTEFALTEAGKAYVAENVQEMAQVWADVNQEAGAGTELRLAMGKLAGAVEQIGLAGTEEQLTTATEALDTARRTIYKLLAD